MSPNSLASCALQPTISPPISVWPHPLSTVIPKRSRNRRACSGDSGAVMLRTYFIGASDVIDSSSASIVIAAGGSTVDRSWKRSTNCAKARVSKRSIMMTAAPARNPKITL